MPRLLTRRLLTIIVACLYKFKCGCRGLEAASARILPAWTLLLFSALASVRCARSRPPVNQQQRMARQTGRGHLRKSQFSTPVNHLVSPPSVLSLISEILMDLLHVHRSESPSCFSEASYANGSYSFDLFLWLLGKLGLQDKKEAIANGMAHWLLKIVLSFFL